MALADGFSLGVDVTTTNRLKSPISHPRAFWNHCDSPIEHLFDSSFSNRFDNLKYPCYPKLYGRIS
jgi:hypothetical protein